MTVYVYFPKATVKTLLVKGIGEIKLKTLTLATAETEEKYAAQQETSSIQLMCSINQKCAADYHWTC